MPRPADGISGSQRLEELTERNLHRLIETEFSLITTFCDIAESEVRLHHGERARGLLQKAALAAKQVRRFSRELLSDAERLEVRQRVDEIENRLMDVFRRHGMTLAAPPPAK
jgi:hypothetical protein